MIQSIKFENTTSTYSLTGKLEYNYKNEDEKNIIYKMFIADKLTVAVPDLLLNIKTMKNIRI